MVVMFLVTLSASGEEAIQFVIGSGIQILSTTTSNPKRKLNLFQLMVAQGKQGKQGLSGAATNQGAIGTQEDAKEDKGRQGIQGIDGIATNQGAKGNQGFQRAR